MKRNLIVTALVAILIGGFVIVAKALTGSVAPPIKGYTEGKEIQFIHTEVSDPEVAALLTKMVDSPVIVVPALAKAPEEIVANVYVFTNGIKGSGPLDFQPDVFDHPPNMEGYSPLRVLHKITWKEKRTARLLKSAAEVKEAEAKGEITIERADVVINMPMLTWPGGKR